MPCGALGPWGIPLCPWLLFSQRSRLRHTHRQEKHTGFVSLPVPSSSGSWTAKSILSKWVVNGGAWFLTLADTEVAAFRFQAFKSVHVEESSPAAWALDHRRTYLHSFLVRCPSSIQRQCSVEQEGKGSARCLFQKRLEVANFPTTKDRHSMWALRQNECRPPSALQRHFFAACVSLNGTFIL